MTRSRPSGTRREAGRRRARQRAAGLVLGYAADRAFGDPRRWHPVSGFGCLAGNVERRGYADSRFRGAVFTTVLVGTAAGAAAALDRVCRNRRLLSTAVTAAATWTALGGTTLAREAGAVEAHLGRDDLEAARRQVTHLVGRDPESMDAHDVARAAIESVAENTSDAVVAPLLWGAAFGPAGLLGYRAANTLDARVGHRSARYERFGWASARLDDLANLAPSRLTALLAMVLAPAIGGSPAAAWSAWARDARQHPSPNAGPVEASFAGALGVRLGGANVYRGVVDDRGTLGDGPAPTHGDIARAVRLAWLVGVCAIVIAAAGAGCRIDDARGSPLN